MKVCLPQSLPQITDSSDAIWFFEDYLGLRFLMFHYRFFRSVLVSGLLKGLVHPKMKIKSLITHPHAVPTP